MTRWSSSRLTSRDSYKLIQYALIRQIEREDLQLDQSLNQAILIITPIIRYLSIRKIMRKYFLPQIVVLLFLLSLLSCGKAVELGVNEISTITLHLGSELTYTIKTPSNISSNEDLYVHVKPTVADPLQVPHLTITSDKDYKQNCYNAHEEFAGICKIVSSELTQGREFTLSIKCVTDCTLEMETYLSDIITLSVGEELQLNAYGAEGLTQVILVQIPSNATYNVLYVSALITNIEQHLDTANQKLKMLINYGNESVLAPTDEKFMAEGQTLPMGGRGAYLSADNAKPGDWIKVYLRLQIGLSVSFSVRSIKDGTQNITLGSSYSDYAQSEQKLYFLNISKQVEELKDRTIEVVFQVYSGDAVANVGFSSAFSEMIQSDTKSSAVRYLLSSSIRTSYNFTGHIYIKVKATVTSQFVFYTKVRREDATYMYPYLTYFGELQMHQVQNFIMVERFAYEQGKNNTVKEYNFNVDIISGQGSFFFKRCESIEKKEGSKQNLSSCLVLNSSEVANLTFLENQLQSQQLVNQNKITIKMTHDIKDCTDLEKKGNIIYKQCGFQIVTVGNLKVPFSFRITAERRFYSTYLKENVLTNDYIYKQSYAFYVFSLLSLKDVDEIDIFVTTFSGESALIVSSSEQFPTLNSTSSDVRIKNGDKNSITLSGASLASTLYISLYGFQFSEVNLAVVVRRSSNSTSSNGSYLSMNSIMLSKGAAVTYTMEKNSGTVRFKLNSLEDESIIVSLAQIQGYNSFKIFDASNKPMTCIGKVDNPLICEIATAKNAEYGIEVFGQLQVLNKFTISYKSNNLDCTALLLNLPNKVVLHAAESQCFSFRIYRNIDLEFVASFTQYQLINKDIEVVVYRGNVELQTVTGSHYTIEDKDLDKFCQLNQQKTGFAKTCNISIKFTSTSQSTQNFNFILEESDAQIALFEGIAQSVHDFDVSSGGGKLFYYSLSNTLPVKVFFTAHTTSNYMLIAKIVNQQEYTKRARDGGVSLWSDYENQQSKNSSFYVEELKNQNQDTSFVVIGQEFINKFCQLTNGCFLLVTIAATTPRGTKDVLQTLSYELQVSQVDSRLVLGQTKVGFIENGLNIYQIDPEDAIIQVRNLESDGSLSRLCVSLYGMTSNGTRISFQNDLGGNYQILKADQITRMFVRTRRDIDYCSYQISYTSMKLPVKTARLSIPYQLSLEANKTQGFLFYNSQPNSFRILTLLSAGQADIYIKPFDKAALTVKVVTEMNFTQFPMVDKLQGDYIVSAKDQQFCYECNYYVVVTTKTKFIGQVIFLRMTDPIPLTTRHFFTEKMSATTQFTSESYIFHSLNSFNIIFNMMYGQIDVTILNPLKQKVVHEKISATKNFNVQAIDYETKEKIELYSSKAAYLIKVAAVDDSSFMVKIDQSGATERIFEGFPTILSLSAGVNTTIQFVNGQQSDKPLTLMADFQQQAGTLADVNIVTVALLDNGTILNSSALWRQMVESDNKTFIFSLNNIRGTYFITVSTNLPLNITFLLFKNALTHLTPSANHFFDKEGIFELPTNYKNVMVEIFNCKGDLQATASPTYQDITNTKVGNSSLITLKRPNYGGHYVFSVENLQESSYFLKIRNKFPGNSLEYLINYYYYDGKNPYNSIDAVNYEITNKMTEDKLIVAVMPPKIAEATLNSIIIKNISYWVYASNSREDLNRQSRCSIKGNVISASSNDHTSISINKSSLSELIEKSDKGTLYVNVQASVEVELFSTSWNQEHYPRVVTILYDTISVQPNGEVLVQYKYWFTDSLLVFLGWMLLPFAIAGVAVYYVIKICFRVLVLRQKEMVEQIELGSSSVAPSIEEKSNVPENASEGVIKQAD